MLVLLFFYNTYNCKVLLQSSIYSIVIYKLIAYNDRVVRQRKAVIMKFYKINWLQYARK